MKFDDALIGVVLGIFSVIVFAVALTFPVIPGQHFGASLFPVLISSGLFICAVMLVVQGSRKRAVSRASLVRASWLRDRRAVLRFLLVPASLVFYFELGSTLGFLLCAFMILCVLFRVFGVTWLRTFVVAFVSVMIIHVMFYSVLKVPLPWGLLEPMAW
ncbi:tripartite tricarboxylate transporter TctB family protein [Alcaligenaceae bacterium]|nr:tripartite tricarboxylate transporter TctB family protein [Alcaligenaceae bacterium]